MRLIKLSANKESFRVVNFNPVGLSFIVGKKTTEDVSKTFNGVGKSLLLTLIHFCLGSRSNERLAGALPDWAFTLEFEVAGNSFQATRTMANSSVILLNGEELKLEEFYQKLHSACFPKAPAVEYLTFRSLIRRFLREKRDAYVSFDTTDAQESGYSKLICNSYLLGLNVEKVNHKFHLKKALDSMTEARKLLKASPRFSTVPKTKKQLTLALQNLDDNILRATRSLDGMRLVENFRDLESRALNLQRQLKIIRNNLFMLHTAMRNIEKSLQIKADVPVEKIRSLYEELNFHFPDNVVEQLNRVESFHNALLSTRQERLSQQKSKLETEVREQQDIERTIEGQHEEVLRYLSAKGVMREYAALSAELSELQDRAGLIREYEKESARIESEITRIRRAFLDANEDTRTYLTAIEELLNGNSMIFRNYTRKLYPICTSGLTVENNDGENLLRYSIDAHIENDRSDGINEAKLFCYDLTLLTTEHEHQVQSIFHDSRLYSDIDPRQSNAMFEIAYGLSSSTGFQYIVSLNENILEGLRTASESEERFAQVYTNNVVLLLTDESPEAKLLGIQIDLDY